MDAITRIKLQKQPKKDFLQETLDNVQEQVNPSAKNTEVNVPYNATTTAPAKPQTDVNPTTIQTATANIKQPENALNQAELQAVNNPTPEQINTNNLIAGAKPSPGVPDNYVVPSPVEFGAKYDSAQMQKDIADPTKGYFYVMQQLNRESAYEGQDEIDKRDKREKQRNLITSIADGLSSIANLGGTLAGGVAQKQTSLSEANTKRREYLRQLRERDREKWQQMMLRTGENQQNYELAKDRQSLLNEAQQSNLRVKEMELALKSQRSQGDIDKIYANIADEKEEQKRKWSEYNLKVNQFNEQVKKNNWQKDVGYIKAGASATSARASQQRANDNTTKTKAEIEMRSNGTWNQKSATGAGSGSKYTPVTAEEQPKPAQAKKTTTPKKGKYTF